MQMERQDARERRADEADKREREADPFVGPALAGDKAALGEVAKRSAKTALALAPHLERLDAQQRVKVKEAADWTSKAAMGVLSLPPEQRPAAYAAALEDGKARGYDLSKMPPQYTPDVEGRLNFHAAQARDVNKYFEEQGNRPQPLGGASPAAPSGDPLARSGTAIAGMESGGQPGGGYGAVGPVANAQGNRA